MQYYYSTENKRGCKIFSIIAQFIIQQRSTMENTSGSKFTLNGSWRYCRYESPYERNVHGQWIWYFVINESRTLITQFYTNKPNFSPYFRFHFQVHRIFKFKCKVEVLVLLHFTNTGRYRRLQPIFSVTSLLGSNIKWIYLTTSVGTDYLYSGNWAIF